MNGFQETSCNYVIAVYMPQSLVWLISFKELERVVAYI
jgi:hypothetical protein